MALHLIPDTRTPHAPTSECGCGPSRHVGRRPDGTYGPIYTHHEPDDETTRGEVDDRAASRT